MIDNQTTTIPFWFWVVAVVALIWNLMGVFAFIADMTISDDMLAELSDAQRAMRDAVPIWAVAAYAIAVFSGSLGGLCLLLRSKVAVNLFAVSLAGIIIQMFNAFILQNGIEAYGAEAMAMPGMIIIAGFLLLLFSRSARNKGWLK